ncbi:MAG: hypothetical protein JXA04_10895 [Gammaproteobacteria bacterium]|nr:hypothetical protein [Gammaproteobacteria bacterium]
MFKKVVNEDEFLELCNQELRRHPDFVEGMEINRVPLHASGSDLSDYDWDGPEPISDIIIAVVDKVRERYGFHIRPGKFK